ncbi:MAG TPA: N-acetylmuramoyl-L-alanine amidase [Candidatus Saccharimonadia bacterium]|nr:N-acetylmuramoyl-L-alanine amidase [Candidatus Saccharimonadia bacterium]
MRPRVLVLLLFVALVGCAPLPWRNPLADWVPSPNHEPRRPILIVLHATEQDSVEESLDTLRTRNSGGPVSSHYLIARDGRIFQLVAEDRRAWHAGPGRWGTITDVNSASIGIELDHKGTGDFATKQIDALLRLMDDLCTRLGIPRSQVIAHADMAPHRKRDPSARFPWAKLAAAGFGPWPAEPFEDPPQGFDPWLALRAVGYPLDDPGAALRAFRRRFRGIEAELTDPPPVLDADDARVLHALTRPDAPKRP